MPRDEETFPKVFERVKKLYRAGKVVLSHHARLREEQRQIETPDLENLIRCGRMVGKRIDPRHPLPTYTIEGVSVDNKKIGCAVAVDEERLIIITTYRNRSPR